MKDKYQVDTGGLRGELPLTDSQKAQISEYIKLVESGAPSNVGVIRWVDDKELNTAYSPGFDLLNIGSDVMPAPEQTTEVIQVKANVEQKTNLIENLRSSPKQLKIPVFINQIENLRGSSMFMFVGIGIIIKLRETNTLTANTRLT